jgi:hypothetical protein
MGDKFVRRDHHFKAERDNVIEGMRESCADDADLVVISIDRKGKLYVASSTTGNRTVELIEQAAEWIEENSVVEPQE